MSSTPAGRTRGSATTRRGSPGDQQHLLPALRRAPGPPGRGDDARLRRAGWPEPRLEGFRAACDLAWYAERGIPGLIFGPGRLEQCHVANEYVETADLLHAAQTYALFVERWCG